MRNVVVSRWSASTPRRRCLAGLVAMAASLIACDSPAGPGKVNLIPSTWTTFLIEGTVTEANGLDVAAGVGRISRFRWIRPSSIPVSESLVTSPSVSARVGRASRDSSSAR
jgi:hypothetical protein